ncbi:MAG: hypothetical protein ACUVRS_03500 [Armatimonadota bacterium]
MKRLSRLEVILRWFKRNWNPSRMGVYISEVDINFNLRADPHFLKKGLFATNVTRATP